MTKELKQLDIDELYHLSARIDEDPVKVADMLFPENPPDRVTLIKKIGQWAIKQTAVLESTSKNRHDVAYIFHKVGERIWQQLPGYAQRVRINVLQINGSRIGANC